MLTQGALDWAMSNAWFKHEATTNAAAAQFVRRFIAGETASDAAVAASELGQLGIAASLSYLGPPVSSEQDAHDVVEQYTLLSQAIGASRFVSDGEMSIKLSSLGQELPGVDGHELAIANARQICASADAAGMLVTVDMEGSETTDATLDLLSKLRVDHPSVGIALQADLVRTESDCRDLSYGGSRVRLCKGSYNPPTGGFETGHAIDLSYVRCLKVLMYGDGYPMVATHDPRMIDIAEALVVRSRRERGSYEFQMLYGIRSNEQLRLAALGERIRAYVPYGQDWMPWVTRRLVEKPSNIALFMRSLASPA